MEVGNLIDFIGEFLVNSWEILTNFQLYCDNYFSKCLRKVGMLIVPKINLIFLILWEKLNFSETCFNFSIKICEWAVLFLNIWVIFYKQFLCYLYFICQTFLLITYTLVKWLFAFDFKISYKLIMEWCRLNFNLIHQCFLITYNACIVIVITTSIKLYSLFSFLSGYTDKIFISEVFFKVKNFWFLSNHDQFGNIPLLIKYFDNFYSSVKYTYLTLKPIKVNSAFTLIFKSELDIFLQNTSKTYKDLFSTNCFPIKTWIVGVYFFFFSTIHIFFKLLTAIISVFYLILDLIFSFFKQFN